MRSDRACLRTASRAVVLAACLGASNAAAHFAPPSVRADRVLTLALSDPPQLTYAIRLSPGELRRERQRADVDGDGVVTYGEADAWIARYREALGRSVRWFGRAAPRTLSETKIVDSAAHGLEGPVGEASSHSRVSFTFVLPLDAREDRLTLEDTSSFLPFDHTEVFVKEGARKLLGLGDDPSRIAPGATLSWVDGGVPQRRTIVVALRPAPRREWIGLLALVVVAAGFLVARVSAGANRRRR